MFYTCVLWFYTLSSTQGTSTRLALHKEGSTRNVYAVLPCELHHGTGRLLLMCADLVYCQHRHPLPAPVPPRHCHCRWLVCRVCVGDVVCVVYGRVLLDQSRPAPEWQYEINRLGAASGCCIGIRDCLVLGRCCWLWCPCQSVR